MAWKQAKVVMLPKPGKDLTKPTSYRPISLLPAIGKVFERIIASKLSTSLEKKTISMKIRQDSGGIIALMTNYLNCPSQHGSQKA